MSNVCGTGGWSGPKPGDPDNNSILTASPAFGGIDVSWTYPEINPSAVAHVLLYRGLLSEFDAAIQIAVASGNTYYDKLDTNYQYYYWIRIVSINGTVGELIGPASATARPLIEDLIVMLTSQIDDGMLAQSLKTDIDRITVNYSELTSEVSNRIASNTALSNALVGVQTGLDESMVFLNTEITQRQEGQSALVTSLNTVAAANANNLAVIQQETTARVTADSALANQYTVLQSTVTSNNTTQNAALLTESTARADADSSLVNQYAALVSTVNSKDSAQSAAIVTEATARTNADSANTNLITTLSSTVAAQATTNTAAIQNEATTRAEADSVLASQITTVQSVAGSNLASAQTTLQTNINTVNGKVTEIGSLYSAKVTVNGLIGGFGVYNNGTTVEAGFDVDTFWIGRTGANKKKPFIISGGEVIIDQGVINTLTFGKLRNEDGSVIVVNGKLSANNIDTVNLNVKGQVNVGSFTGYTWPAAGLGGAHLSQQGLLLGNVNGGGRYFQIISGHNGGGDAQILTNIPAYIENAQINTLKIGLNAVTVPSVDYRIAQVSGNNTIAVVGDIHITLDQAGWVYAIFTANQTYGSGMRWSTTWLSIAGEITSVGGEAVTTNIAVSMSRYLPAGTHRVYAHWQGADSGVRVDHTNLFVMGVKR